MPKIHYSDKRFTCSMRGDIPRDLLQYMFDNFGSALRYIDDYGHESVSASILKEYPKSRSDKQSPGARLRYFRQKAEMTQDQLALQAGFKDTSRKIISEYERNGRKISERAAHRFSKIFGVSWLMFHE